MHNALSLFCRVARRCFVPDSRQRARCPASTYSWNCCAATTELYFAPVFLSSHNDLSLSQLTFVVLYYSSCQASPLATVILLCTLPKKVASKLNVFRSTETYSKCCPPAIDDPHASLFLANKLIYFHTFLVHTSRRQLIDQDPPCHNLSSICT